MVKKQEQSSDVLGKLDKVADSLERSSVQLSGAVSQQQLDIVRERISALENELKVVKGGLDIIVSRTAAHADEAETGIEALVEEHTTLERDFAGTRALAITSFVLGSISLICIIIMSL
jgi:hypothetical protein|tara:strand:+ start:904 stop:1257 length:354 start_codon:yes stop_codon:yes gene_type:complete